MECLGIVSADHEVGVIEHAENRPVEGGRIEQSAFADQVGKSKGTALDLVVTPAVIEAAGDDLQLFGAGVFDDLTFFFFCDCIGVDQQTVVAADIFVGTFLAVAVDRPQDRRVADKIGLKVRIFFDKASGILIPDQGTSEPAQLIHLVGTEAEGIRRGIPYAGRIGNRRHIHTAPEDRGIEDSFLHIPDLVTSQHRQVRFRQVFCDPEGLLSLFEDFIFPFSEFHMFPVDRRNQLLLF